MANAAAQTRTKINNIQINRFNRLVDAGVITEENLQRYLDYISMLAGVQKRIDAQMPDSIQVISVQKKFHGYNSLSKWGVEARVGTDTLITEVNIFFPKRPKDQHFDTSDDLYRITHAIANFLIIYDKDKNK